MGDKTITNLKLYAAKSRRNVLRMIQAGGCGHIGGAFSCIDIITALYFYKMNIDPANPKKPDRDRFLLSAGHKCMAQYGVLAERGFFDKKILDTYGKLNSKLPGHPDMHKLNGVEGNTGALGHGLSLACGMALGLRSRGSDSTVYVVMGDGELAEGSNWEAAAAAAHHNIENLVAFVDKNGLQISGKTSDIMNFEPLDKRFEAFGWNVKEVDGNDMEQIIELMDRLPLKNGKPTLVVANTVKAKGLSLGEGKVAYHYWKPSKEELETVIKETEEIIHHLESTVKEVS